MPAHPDWVRWLFASIAVHLRDVAEEAGLPSLVEHLEDRSMTFMNATDRAELRITGPFTQELSKGFHRVQMDINVLLTSHYGPSTKNGYDIHRYAGLFHEALTMPIPVWNYGDLTGDFSEDDPDSQVFLGCLLPRPGKNDMTRVYHFGQTTQTDKLKQTAVDARYYIELSE